MTATATPVLEVSGLGKSFLGVAALQDVGFTLREGSVLGLIGPNGSGKSTALDCITGFTRPDSGQVRLRGRDISGRPAHQIARSGLVRTFQTIRLYDELTVGEHLGLALRGLSAEDAGSDDLRQYWLEAFKLLRFRDAPAGILSYGQKKLVALAAVLVARPAVVLLDEPLAGVNPLVIEVIDQAIKHANEAGQTFLIIEHNVEFITSCCAEVVVLDAGRKLAEGPPSLIWDDPAVYEAFLGRKADDDDAR
jgi:branched-chain amino acid transport system ATP-binding protein